MNHILETVRLILRQFTVNDAKFIVELVNSDGWIKYIGDRKIHTEEQAIKYLLEGPLKSYELNGFGLCLVEIKENGTPIGMCGLLKRDNIETPDIGFAFLPQYTGKGFAFEIASATMTFAKDTLKLPVISAITVPHNTRSIKLLEKLGFQFKQTYSFPNKSEELMLFSN